MYNLIQNYKSISFIGMSKNVGKTTVLNHLIKECFGKKKIGLTSIGRDGESLDVVFGTTKPKIYIEEGTIVATARGCLNNSDCTIKILETTNITTPLGDIVLVEAMSNGYIDIAGPSYKLAIKKIINKLHNYNADVVFIDGALGRKGSADNYITDATILSTGVAYSNNIDELISDTVFAVDMLSLPNVCDEISKIISTIDSKVSIITNENKLAPLNIITSLNSGKEIINYIDKDIKYLVINGAFTEKLANTLIENRHKYDQLTVIVDDGTKIFIDKNHYIKLLKSNVSINVINKTKVLAVTINPTSPFGEMINEEKFENLLKSNLEIPIINVCKE